MALVSKPRRRHPGSFHKNRPSELKKPRWGFHLSYIQQALPIGLKSSVSFLPEKQDQRVLDYGCADKPYRNFFPDDCRYEGADLPGNEAAEHKLLPDGSLDVADGVFDTVFSTQVLEHVADPALYLSEAYRVLKPGGYLLLSTHGFMFWHNDPVDYWRWTGEGLEYQLQNSGFEVKKLDGILGMAAVGIQFFQDATFIHLPRRMRRLYCWMMQAFVRWADRIDSTESKRRNAMVFVVICQKPDRSQDD